jgi:uncharacterized protein (TIGR03083 family)
MAAASPWPFIHTERAALVADLSVLPPESWQTRSLCSEWSVRDVLGHMTSTARMTPPKFFVGLARSGFNFDKMSAGDVKRETAGSPSDQLTALSVLATASTHPPGPVEAMLGEVIVHGEDIRRPLGIVHDYPMSAVTRALDFYKTSNLLIGSKKRITGVTLRATDADWSTGAGPEVSGPALSLVLAMTGRAAALDDLSGDGLATLRAQM